MVLNYIYSYARERNTGITCMGFPLAFTVALYNLCYPVQQDASHLTVLTTHFAQNNVNNQKYNLTNFNIRVNNRSSNSWFFPWLPVFRLLSLVIIITVTTTIIFILFKSVQLIRIISVRSCFVVSSVAPDDLNVDQQC